MKTSSPSVGRRWTVYYTPQSLSLIYSIEIPLKLNVDGAEYNSHDNDYKGVDVNIFHHHSNIMSFAAYS
jgi:hypothetical protein